MPSCVTSSPGSSTSIAGTIGAEFAHVSNSDERLWLQDEFQAGRMQHRFSVEERRNLLWQLTAAEGLERYLHTKYVGQKRFSLEGAEALIALLNDLIQQGGVAGVEEFVLGMAHRGRLNVLVNVLGKSPAQLFSEFEGKYDENHMQGSGDVKYHKGFSADLRTAAATCMSRWPSILRISRSSIPWSKVRCAAPGTAQRCAQRQGRATADSRRCRFWGPGRRYGDAAAVAGARLPHRRHDAHHR